MNEEKQIGHPIKKGGYFFMGQNHQFKHGDKAPNNGIYIEVGETNSNVRSPKQIKLRAGDHFPETTNQDRVWTYARKP